MKIKDIIKSVNKSKQFFDQVYIYDIAQEMDLFNINNYGEQNRLVSYYIGNWHCTDYTVGYKVYFFDDEPVAVSSQTARKMDEEFEWLSKELYLKVKEYVLTFDQETIEPSINILDPEEEIGETYKINYHGDLYDYHKNIPLYKGENVKIVDVHKGQQFNTKKQYEPSLVKIKMLDDSELWLEMKELDFPYNIISDKK